MKGPIRIHWLACLLIGTAAMNDHAQVVSHRDPSTDTSSNKTPAAVQGGAAVPTSTERFQVATQLLLNAKDAANIQHGIAELSACDQWISSGGHDACAGL
jgi:hypothetical protein